MKDGIYVTTDIIHIYTCTYGALFIKKNELIEIKRKTAYFNNEIIPMYLIEMCKDNLKPF